ncbi:1-deoxy-D-xylulose-5-phosphate synthase [Bacillus carboniphilus]|uniref:1-deoxy-D-xylulose-5-phosphate synthase n=1 Tax=Bacillus carboniphilus TaxID=86663 RepID=A0ABY9K223_9BACI|nr:1-deoxy-D-xylulose-5-phosphate synthase [Bacillus carboniphilus]WLR43880.1 1-deoxy-D-xylulose-5-phosphate synthase [Bacillus carboniphilus]
MDLTNIENPQFLKHLSKEQLEQLSYDIRQFLIEKLSKTGGHIGPNLGVVELTIALHKVFDSPKDKFLWDVGHQAYVHKILTGRAKDFDTLRQYKGLSGFPKRAESEHDVWETGHSSTSLSAAMGMVIARDIKRSNEHIVPIIGDGALTGGMALEALNHIGHEQKDIIVVLNDNEMSIAPNVGALHNVLGRMRTAGKYNWVKDEIEYLIKRVPAVGGKLASTAERVKDSLKYLFVSGMFFEEMGFTYLGPVDGHDFNDLFENLNYAKKTKGPVLLHVMTKKGKGYHPAEKDKVGTWHGTGPYKIDTGDFLKPKLVAPSWSKLVAETVRNLAREDRRIVAITPAMPVGSKLEGFAKEFPDRMFDVGIAEQHATTMAAGLAAVGMKPFLAIYSTFLQRAYDQMVHDICRQNLNVFIGIDRSGLVGADGETHNGIYDIAFLRHVPNIVVMMPKDENEGQHMVNTAIKYNDGPIALRYPRGNGLGVELDDQLTVIPIGSWEVLRDGSDAVILTFGTTIQMALEAADQLEKNLKLSVRVVNSRFIKPLDGDMLAEIYQEGLPILTIEEAALQGGFGSAVLEHAQENGYDPLLIKRMGIPDYFVEHGSVNLLLEEIDLTKEKVMENLRLMIQKKDRKKIL